MVAHLSMGLPWGHARVYIFVLQNFNWNVQTYGDPRNTNLFVSKFKVKSIPNLNLDQKPLNQIPGVISDHFEGTETTSSLECRLADRLGSFRSSCSAWSPCSAEQQSSPPLSWESVCNRPKIHQSITKLSRIHDIYYSLLYWDCYLCKKL